jgi:hypothetical protein
MKSRLVFAVVLMIVAPLSIVWTTPSQAADSLSNESYEARVVHALLIYCVPALMIGDSVARVAQMQNFPELSAVAEAAFLGGKPGKAFGLPYVGAGAVLTAPNTPLCSIHIQKLDLREFVKQLDFWFGQGPYPWKLEINDVLADGEIKRQYSSPAVGATLLVIVHARPRPVEGGIQALITVGRAGN